MASDASERPELGRSGHRLWGRLLSDWEPTPRSRVDRVQAVDEDDLLAHFGFATEQLRRVLEFDRLRSMFYFLLWRQDACVQEGWGTPGGYYQFGIGEACTLTRFLRALRAYSRHHRRELSAYPVFGFDTFSGLPEPADEADRHPAWEPGGFAQSREEVVKRIAAAGFPPDRSRVRLIEGDYRSVLTDSLRSELQVTPPSIVSLDVKYYSSTRFILDWIRPILPSGTIFYFEGIWKYHGNPRYGDLRAINEFDSAGDGLLTRLDEYATPSTRGRIFVYTRENPEFT